MLRKCAISSVDAVGKEFLFHGFSTNYEELRDGVGQYPAAIVEDISSGAVSVWPADCVVFSDSADPELLTDSEIEKIALAYALSVVSDDDLSDLTNANSEHLLGLARSIEKAVIEKLRGYQ